VVERFISETPELLFELLSVKGSLGDRFQEQQAELLAIDLDGRVRELVEALQLTYPVGYSQRAGVDGYLGRTGNEMLSIPQIVIIDRTGMIRVVNGGQTNPTLEDIN
jgi:hypothetical protein